MLTKVDEEQLQRVCVNEETLFAARKLVPLAKARTKQGSGHHLAELATGLPAICAYLVSKQLNNNDVTLDNARHASCLRANDFSKALRTVSGVLESDLSPKKWKRTVSYDPFCEEYNAGQPLENLRTPRRSSKKPLRDLPTRESMRKRRLISTMEQPPSEAVDDVAAPQTPSKKRKLDVPSLTPLTKGRVITPPITPAASHITYVTPMKSEKKANSTPTIPSSLRRSARFALQQEVDASIEIDEEEEQVPADVNRSLKAQFAKIDEEDPMGGNYSAHRRLYPAYQDYKQWFTRDARVLKMWKEASVIRTALVK